MGRLIGGIWSGQRLRGCNPKHKGEPALVRGHDLAEKKKDEDLEEHMKEDSRGKKEKQKEDSVRRPLLK